MVAKLAFRPSLTPGLLRGGGNEPAPTGFAPPPRSPLQLRSYGDGGLPPRLS